VGTLDGLVIVVTGAGRGMGREHALLCASEGAHLVINDTGADVHGEGHDPSVIRAVETEIASMGAPVVATDDDVSTMDGAQRVVDAATATYGQLDVLVNCAGILRDKMFVNMSEEDWDAVIAGHLKSVFCPTRLAAAHWRDRSKAGEDVRASVISMSSTSGLIGQVGQTNYGAAKAGIASLTIILSQELARYGVRVNALTPVARTRMTDSPGVSELVKPPEDPTAFDAYLPANVSPMVGWLATRECPVTGKVFYVKGSEVRLFTSWHHEPFLATQGRWTVSGIADAFSAAEPGASAEAV
jgi:NAD(P)-dependent dehydrogenase (short-subunit alcohol dehydrogenase family)